MAEDADRKAEAQTQPESQTAASVQPELSEHRGSDRRKYQREWKRADYERNPAKYLERSADYRAEHRATVNARQRERTARKVKEALERRRARS